MKKTICILLVLTSLLALVLSGCADKTAGQVFRLDILSEPASLDPQIAVSNEQELILLNTMEGLLRMDERQKPVPAAAESYTVSPDGRTYTFTLRRGMLWSDGETPVTAYDFQFAFRRLFDPKTQSSTAANFTCIRGGAATLSGERSVQSIGVAAQDAYTLVFTLESPNPSFLSLLTTPAALPCNEDFFLASRGKYGVSDEFMLFNGPFFVHSWVEGTYIHMRKNPAYYAEESVIPAAFRLYIQESYDLARLLDGAVDAAAVSFSDLEKLDESFQTVQFSNILWSVLPNLERPALANLSIRQALAAGIEREALAAHLGKNQQPAAMPVPPAVTLGGESYRAQAADAPGPAQSGYTAAELFQIGLKELDLEGPPSLTLLCPDRDGIPLLLSHLQRQWRDALGIFINIEPVDAQTFSQRLSSRDYDLVFCPVTASYDSPEAVLSQLCGESSLTGWQSGEMAGFLAQAKRSSTAAGVLSAYRQAEQALLQNGIVLPLFYETSYYAAAPSVTGLRFSPFGCRVYFLAGRKDG